MSFRILVTGANGQLAQTIKKLIDVYNYEADWTFASINELDITSKGEISAFFENGGYDYCINCAAYTDVEGAEKNPEDAFLINATAVKFLAQKCKEFNTILIHLSTDYVFDGKENEPYKIEAQANPINEYGKSKLRGEEHIQETLDKFFIIRTSWLYSKEFGKNFYKWVLNKARNNEDLYVVDNQTGCPTDCKNLAKVILKLISSCSQKFGIHHYTDKRQMTWHQFAKQILEDNNLLEQTNLFRANNYTTFALRPSYSVLENSLETEGD